MWVFCVQVHQRTKTIFQTPPPPPEPPRLLPNLCMPLKIFAGLSKHLPMFIVGKEDVVGGGLGIVVVVCGKICGCG